MPCPNIHPARCGTAQRLDGVHATWAVVEHLVTATTPSAVATVLGRVLRDSGYDHVECLLAPSVTHAGATEDGLVVLLDTRPAAWIQAYEREKCMATDPFVREGCRRIDAITWRSLFEMMPEARSTPAAALARMFGMTDGIIVPVITDDRRTGLVIAAGRAGEPRPDLRRTLTIAAILAVQRLLAIRRAASPVPIKLLSAREAEVLHWIMVGKSDWQIGQILSISAKTVNFHVENVKRKFGVATRMQAVVAAMRIDGGGATTAHCPSPTGRVVHFAQPLAG